MVKENDVMSTYEMTEEELWEEEVYYRLDIHEYVIVDDKIYNYETGELICLLSEIGLNNN